MSFRNADGLLHLSAVSQVHSGFSLFTVNTTTGFATEIGDLVVWKFGNSLAFSPADTLYFASTVDITFAGTLYTVDQVTGAGGSPSVALTYLGFPVLQNPRLSGLEFDPCSGVAYAAVNDREPGLAQENYLATVDTSTGDVTNIGPTVGGLDGLAFYRAEAGCCHAPLAGPVLYPHTLFATSATRFDWYLPEDVVVVKGDLSAVSTYGTTSTTPLAMATWYTDGAAPVPGAGFYYLVRGDCSAASWSSGGAGECAGPAPPPCPAGERDGNLP
jgi:hypothetical protein